MPEGKDYWNPYRLVPARDKVDRRAPWTDERFRGVSGLIHCTLENLTPLFIGVQSSGPRHSPLRREKHYRVVPGSSLKGMLRSLAELVGGGCFVVSDINSPKPPHANACTKREELCITCRMFGAMGKGSNAWVHKGKVSIGDAVIKEAEPRPKDFEVLLANHGVRHEPFYRSPHTNKLDGESRKLYFHQPQRKESTPAIPEGLKTHAWKINAVLPGHHFDFEVQFTSLEDDEFSLLLYVLHLEEHVDVQLKSQKLRLQGPMRHKIGNAKPLGMGSCHIRVNRLTLFPSPKDRFSTMGTQNNSVWESQELESKIQKHIQPFVEDKSPTMVALRKMMVWDERDPRVFRYPTFHEFKSREFTDVPLKKL